MMTDIVLNKNCILTIKRLGTFEKVLMTETPGCSSQPFTALEIIKPEHEKPIHTTINQKNFSAKLSALIQYANPWIDVVSQ